MPICNHVDCKDGPNGGRFAGSTDEVREHRITVHGESRTKLYHNTRHPNQRTDKLPPHIQDLPWYQRRKKK